MHHGMCYGRCKSFTLYWCPLLVQAPASSSSPPAAASSVSLTDVSVEEVLTILENLSFSTLVDPFRRNGISGESFNYIDSYTDIMELDKAGISKIVARTFYEKYVMNWKASNSIPNNLLQISSTTSNLKVCMQYVCMVDYAYCCALLNVYSSIHQLLLSFSFKLLYVCNRAAAVPPIASRHLRRWGFLTTPASPYSFSPYYIICIM